MKCLLIVDTYIHLSLSLTIIWTHNGHSAGNRVIFISKTFIYNSFTYNVLIEFYNKHNLNTSRQHGQHESNEDMNNKWYKYVGPIKVHLIIEISLTFYVQKTNIFLAIPCLMLDDVNSNWNINFNQLKTWKHLPN